MADNVVTVPLKRSGKLLMIEGEADGVKGNFIFDTGAPYLVLNMTYFRGKVQSGTNTAGGITGSEIRQQTTSVQHFSFQGITYQNVDADILPLGHIEDTRGVKILGLMGLNLFKDFEIEIDVQKNILVLYKCNRSGETIAGQSFRSDFTHPIKISNDALFLDCAIAGRRVGFVLDTGAEINTLSSFAGKKVLATVEIQGRSQLMGTGRQKVEVLYGRMNDFFIGDTDFKGMQTLITNMSDMSASYGTPVDGMLGYDFLARGVLQLNFRKKTLAMQFFDTLETSE